ncbi:MAG: DUF4397 domain-containing protein [Armatimonadota bacterium]
MHRFRIAATLFLACIAMAMPALALDDYPPTGAGGPTDLCAYVRMVNLLPGSPPLTVTLDNFTVLDNLAYARPFGYQGIMQRSYLLTLRPTGTATTAPPLVAANVRFTSQFYYTVVAMPTPQGPGIVQLYDDPKLPPSGQVRVRYLNAVLSAPSLIISANGQPLATSVPYGYTTPYLTLPQNQLTTSVTWTGCTTPPTPVTFPQGKVRVATVIIYGDARQTGPLGALVLPER